jgi:glutaminyl-peptide cyclotransferase
MTDLRLIVAMGVTCALLGVGLVVVAAGAGEDDRPPSAASRLKVDRFDAGRAFAELRREVASGERPAGSPTSRALAERIRRALPHGRFEDLGPANPGQRNVVGSLPGRKPALVLAAHYDTKLQAGFVGANDGASGTAALLELARVLRHAKRPRDSPELRFVFFDGEESPDDNADFYATGLRGSKAYAARHRREVGALVLLDYVGEKHLRIPREGGSDPALWRELRSAAQGVGAGSTFPSGSAGEILDDHTPFTRAGVRAVDLIDFDFACFHQTCDDSSAVSADSLDRVGETLVELVRRVDAR